jgi:hypothetical protein
MASVIAEIGGSRREFDRVVQYSKIEITHVGAKAAARDEPPRSTLFSRRCLALFDHKEGQGNREQRP